MKVMQDCLDHADRGQAGRAAATTCVCQAKQLERELGAAAWDHGALGKACRNGSNSTRPLTWSSKPDLRLASPKLPCLGLSRTRMASLLSLLWPLRLPGKKQITWLINLLREPCGWWAYTWESFLTTSSLTGPDSFYKRRGKKGSGHLHRHGIVSAESVHCNWGCEVLELWPHGLLNIHLIQACNQNVSTTIQLSSSLNIQFKNVYYLK